MKKYSNSGRILILIAITGILFTACKKKEGKDNKDPNADIKGNYFSIRQFGTDQWSSYLGCAPFLILKTTKENGKTDSSYSNSDTLNWGNIFKPFFETDISDRQFLSQYTYSQFTTPEDGTMNLYYKANDPDIFTQKLLITVDENSGKVKAIYIETYKKDLWDECKQILFYSPMRLVQIQTDDKPVFGAKKYTVVEYNFLRERGM